MHKVITAVALGTLGLAGTALAQDKGELSYTFVEAGYVNSEVKDLHIDGNGFGVRGSLAFTDRVHGFASYSDQDYDFDIGISQFEIGAGVNWSLAPALDLIGTVSYLNMNADVPGFRGMDDSGFALGAGVRAKVTQPLELRGEVKYVNFDDSGSDTTLSVGARYYFTQMFALGADVGFNDAGTNWMLGARIDFK